MKLTEDILIDAPPERVWRALADPTMMELWNPKCERCELPPGVPVSLGFEFTASFRLRQNLSQGTAEITEFDPPRNIAFAYSMDASKPLSSAVERFELSDASQQKTRVLHTVAIDDSKLTFLLRCLVRFICRFGKRSKKSTASSLETLKVLIETDWENSKKGDPLRGRLS